jgi:hypothetical protein
MVDMTLVATVGAIVNFSTIPNGDNVDVRDGKLIIEARKETIGAKQFHFNKT